MLSALLAPEDQDDLDLQIVIKSGDTRDEIVSTIGERRADIVVMGTHGRGLFGRWLIGSITQGILRKVSIPILTVCKATRPMSLNRILFATDLCEASRHGFGHVLELAMVAGTHPRQIARTLVAAGLADPTRVADVPRGFYTALQALHFEEE